MWRGQRASRKNERGNTMSNTLQGPPQTFINSRNLRENNLVYVAGEGRNLVAADTEVGVNRNSTDVFVQTPQGETGIYHPRMMQQFRAQHHQQHSGNRVVDQAREDIDFERYAGEEARDYVQLQTFKALGNKFKGTELGNSSREAYALGNYSKDAFNANCAKYGDPRPGKANPYNAAGRQNYEYSQSVQDPQMQQQMQLQRMMQMLVLMSLFRGSSMGFMPMMMASWMR